MGGIWLRSLPDVLRNAGLDVDLWDGWENRARSTGGYDDLLAVQVHHTASNASVQSDCSYMWEGSPDKPVGAIHLARTGLATVGAAGATNTSGKGGPMGTSKGTIPLDAANRYVISIEAANEGTGEPWPQAQIDAYIKMVAALCDEYDIQVAPGDVHSHWEWTTRKIDPAGNSPYATGGNKWNMDKFRTDVKNAGPVVPPTPIPNGEVDMIILDLNPGTDWWVAMLLGNLDLSHLVNGWHVDTLERGGVPRVTVIERDIEGILLSVATSNDSPFAPGMPSHNQALNDAWNAVLQPHPSQ